MSLEFSAQQMNIILLACEVHFLTCGDSA